MAASGLLEGLPAPEFALDFRPERGGVQEVVRDGGDQRPGPVPLVGAQGLPGFGQLAGPFFEAEEFFPTGAQGRPAGPQGQGLVYLGDGRVPFPRPSQPVGLLEVAGDLSVRLPFPAGLLQEGLEDVG